MTFSDTLEARYADLKAAAESAGDTASLRAALEDVLREMMPLDAGMVDGEVVARDVVTRARDALAAVAEGLFDRLADSDEAFAFDWLGQLPAFLAPRGIDYARWRERLGVPADREEYWRMKRNRSDDEIERIVAGVGETGDRLSLQGVERCFDVTLPTALKTAWQTALDGGENLLGLLVPARGLRQLLETARFVSEDQVQYGIVTGTAGGRPFVLLPIAAGYEDTDIVALNLARTSPARGDFEVVYCMPGVGEPGARFESSAAWMAHARSVMTLVSALREAARADEAAIARIGEWIDGGDETAFEAWGREAMRARAPHAVANEEAVREALDLLWASPPTGKP